MRSVVWILGLGLAACAALFFAWRLLPAEPRQGAAPHARPVAPAAPRGTATDLRGVEAHVSGPGQAGPGESDGRLSAQAPDEPLVQPAGLEEGGQAQAGRPLPDFSAKYQGLTRESKALALRGLEEAIRARSKELSESERSELESRLANEPVSQAPAPKVAELLATIDERQWLLQALASPAVVDR